MPTKNELIAKTRKVTKERRRQMTPKIIKVKIQENRLSKADIEHLEGIFREAKWLRNLAVFELHGPRSEFNYSALKKVEVLNKDKEYEQRDLKYLTSQMKQKVVDEIGNNLSSLSASKKNGCKVGALKYKSRVCCVGLKQYGTTYEVKAHNKIHIQGFGSRALKVNGLEQLNVYGNYEFADAKLIKKVSGYYIYITVYVELKKLDYFKPKIGVDFGISNALTFSDGTIVNYQLRESGRLKNLNRKLSRQEKGSNGWKKTKAKIRKEEEKRTNRKNDSANKLISYLNQEFLVYFQDENLSSWRRKNSVAHGNKKIQYGILGRVKDGLRKSSDNVMLGRWVATTATCHKCLKKTKHSLDKRVFKCACCGYENHRDIHAAQNMIILSSSGTDGSLNSTVDPSEGQKPLLNVGLIEKIPRVVVHNVYAKPEDPSL